MINNIPDVLIIEVFAKWIDIYDFCKIDTSLTNTEQRTFFLALIQQKGLMLNGIRADFYDEQGLLFLQWIYLRKIKLQYILFQIQNIAVFELLNIIILSGVKVLKIFSFEPKHGSLLKLISNCINLERLTIKNSTFSDSVVYHMPRLGQLKYLKLYSDCSSFTMDSILRISTKCYNLEKIVFIFSGCNGNSQHINVNDALLLLLSNNTNLKEMKFDLVDRMSGVNNTNLLFLSQICNKCEKLLRCELKYYGILDISFLTKFILSKPTIDKLYVEITDTENGLISKYLYCSNHIIKQIIIVNHIVYDYLTFDYLFIGIKYTNIELNDIISISQNVILNIATYSNVYLKSIIIDNCGRYWTNESFNKILISCINLEYTNLNFCNQIIFSNIVELIEKHNVLRYLTTFIVANCSGLYTQNLIDFFFHLKKLIVVKICDCINVNIILIREYILLNMNDFKISYNSSMIDAIKEIVNN
jgi:hypothetical protein